MLTPYYKLYNEKKASTFQTALDIFLNEEIKHSYQEENVRWYYHWVREGQKLLGGDGFKMLIILLVDNWFKIIYTFPSL